MFGRVNTTTRSKPVLVVSPNGTDTPGVPGMISPPDFAREADGRLRLIAGVYAGETSRVRWVTLDGVPVNYRLSAGRFTPEAGDAGKLLVNHETITGSDGSITRQASVIVRPGPVPIALIGADTVISAGTLISA